MNEAKEQQEGPDPGASRVLTARDLLPVAAFTALADLFFFGHPLGFTGGCFAGLLLVAIAVSRPASRWSRCEVALGVAVLGLCLRCVYEPSRIGLALLASGLALLAAGRHVGWRGDAWDGLMRLSCLATRGIAWAAGQIVSLAARPGGATVSGGVRAFFVRWALPLLLGAVFAGLFAFANPIIGDALDRFWLYLTTRDLPHPDFMRLLFWIAVFVCLTALLCFASGAPSAEPRAADGPIDALVPPDVLVRALVLFNLLFAVQTLLDVTYLWGGAALPEGMTYARYAHRGAYVLVFTALLAGAFALVAFRPGMDDARLRLERRLMLLWLGQNVFLVVSSAWRLWLYVNAYSLTRLRVCAAIWMALVVCGLVLIAFRLLKRRSGRWLLNANAAAAVLVLYAVAWTGIDAHVARFNVRHCEEVRGPGHPAIDAAYLQGLGIDAIPALLWIAGRLPDHERAPLWQGALDSGVYKLTNALAHWQGWTPHRARLRDLVADRPDMPPAPVAPPGSVAPAAPPSSVDPAPAAAPADLHGHGAEPELQQAGERSTNGPDSHLNYRRGTPVFTQYTDGIGRRRVSASHDDEPGPVADEPGTESGAVSSLVHDAGPPLLSATGQVVALRPGRLVLRAAAAPGGAATNRSYGLSRQMELRGVASLSELQVDQRVAFRYHDATAMPVLVELAARGAVLGGTTRGTDGSVENGSGGEEEGRR